MPGIDEDEALGALRDPCWRLSRFYSIRTRDGSIIKFRPRPQQRQIIDLIYRRGCRRVNILKARQLGFSTLLGVVCADRLCFGMGQQISLIDGLVDAQLNSDYLTIRNQQAESKLKLGEQERRLLPVGYVQALLGERSCCCGRRCC